MMVERESILKIQKTKIASKGWRRLYYVNAWYKNLLFSSKWAGFLKLRWISKKRIRNSKSVCCCFSRKDAWMHYDETVSELTTIFLILLTTYKWVPIFEHVCRKSILCVRSLDFVQICFPKYRILSSFYLLFRVADNVMLLALVVALLMNVPTDRFSEVLAKHVPVFSILAVEGFYSIMEYTVRIWILNGSKHVPKIKTVKV